MRILFCGLLALAVVIGHVGAFTANARVYGRLLHRIKCQPDQGAAVVTGTMPEGSQFGTEMAEGPAKEQFDRSNSLFIGSLPFALGEEALSGAITERLGALSTSVKNVVLVKNPKTGLSRGYGYINFVSAEDVTMGKEKLDGLQFDDRPCRIDVSVERTPEERAPREKARRPRESAQQFDAAEGSERAERPAPREKREFDQRLTVYMGNLGYSVTAEEVQALCDERLGAGKVKTVRMAFDKFTGKHRGYAHVDFYAIEDASQAVETLDGVELAGRPLKAGPAVPKAELTRSVGGSGAGTGAARSFDKDKPTLFVGNLDFGVTEEILSEMLTDLLKDLPANAIQSIHVSRDRVTDQSRGFAHVVFDTMEQARLAMDTLSSYILMGRALRVDLAAQSKGPGGAGGGGRTSGSGSDFDRPRSDRPRRW